MWAGELEGRGAGEGGKWRGLGAIGAQNGEGMRGRRCQRERNAGNGKGHQAPGWAALVILLSAQSTGQSSKTNFTDPAHPQGMAGQAQEGMFLQGSGRDGAWGLCFVPQVTADNTIPTRPAHNAKPSHSHSQEVFPGLPKAPTCPPHPIPSPSEQGCAHREGFPPAHHQLSPVCSWMLLRQQKQLQK